jgi:hypothetical protein
MYELFHRLLNNGEDGDDSMEFSPPPKYSAGANAVLGMCSVRIRSIIILL